LDGNKFSLTHYLCFLLLGELLGSITNKYANLWKLLTLIAKFQLCCGPWSIFPAFFLFGVAFLHHWNFRIANKIWMKANPIFVTLFLMLGKAGSGTHGLGWSKNWCSSLWGISWSINVLPKILNWSFPERVEIYYW